MLPYFRRIIFVPNSATNSKLLGRAKMHSLPYVRNKIYDEAMAVQAEGMGEVETQLTEQSNLKR